MGRWRGGEGGQGEKGNPYRWGGGGGGGTGREGKSLSKVLLDWINLIIKVEEEKRVSFFNLKQI